jgi:6-phosphogluconolactonase (cycloisomerase 2 family)
MAERRRLWIGTYTAHSDPAGGGSGVHEVHLDTATGGLTGGAPAAPADGPSFLAAHPGGRLLFAVAEKPAGAVAGFAVGAALTPTGTAATGGGSPCHLAVHPAGRHVIAANYADGRVSVHPIGADGAPGAPVRVVGHTGSGPDADRQEGPHAHSVTVAPGGRHLLVADLGTDELRCLAFDPGAADPVTGVSVATRFPPGTGPRHLAAHPDGRLFAVGELDCRVHVLRWDPATVMAPPADAVPASGAGGAGSAFPSEIALSADGTRLYVANRGPDTIAAFDVTGERPLLLAEEPAGGAWPRHFALVDGWIVVALQRSGELTSLPVDPRTGVPGPPVHRLPVPDPACVLPA